MILLMISRMASISPPGVLSLDENGIIFFGRGLVKGTLDALFRCGLNGVVNYELENIRLSEQREEEEPRAGRPTKFGEPCSHSSRGAAPIVSQFCRDDDVSCCRAYAGITGATCARLFRSPA